MCRMLQAIGLTAGCALFLSIAPGLSAQEPPAMPMKALYEDGAEYRWLRKKVLDSRLLDSMEDLSTWTMQGRGQLTLSDVRVRDGRHSLRLRSTLADQSNAPDAGGGGWGGPGITRTFPGEDWSRYNRISIWIYPEVVGSPAISFSMTLRNEGATKVPDAQNEGRHESIILQNRAWNHVVWEIAPIARDKITSLNIAYSESKRLADPGDSAVFYIDKLELERVDPDHTEGWNVAPGRIAFSHSGYAPGASKSAIASDLAASEFSVVRQDTGEVVLSKPVRRAKTDLGEYQVLDFSEVRQPGTYAIQAGDRLTRSFRIGTDAWRSSIWKAINFLYSERCGMEIPGIHGRCHNDCYITHGNKRIVVNGAWHDAGDLSATGHTPEIVYGLLSFAAKLQAQGEDPVLCRRLVDEAKWGLEWVLRTRFGDGYRVRGQLISVWTNGIMGDADDRFGEAQNSANVNLIDAALEALAYRVLKDSDPELAIRSLRTAEEDFEFALKGLDKPDRPTPTYGSVDEMDRASLGVLAATNLFQATGSKRYADKAFEFAGVVLASQQRTLPRDWKMPLTGFFYTAPNKENILQRFHVGNEQAPIVALSRLCEVFPDHKDWMKWYSATVLHSEYYLKAAAKVNEPYGTLPAAIYRESDVRLIPEKSEWRQLAQASRSVFLEQVRRGVPLGGEYYLRRFPVWFEFRGNHSVLLSEATALSAAAHVRGDLDSLDLAQKQAQWVVGRNPFAASTMYGEGYDWAPLYTVRSGHLVGALPVGIQTLGNNDAPYWPTQICWTYKEVWVHSVARWLWLMQDISGPALVEGLVEPSTLEPVEFREQATGQVTSVKADFASGSFRAPLAEGRYTVTHGGRRTTVVLLPGNKYRVDLRPGQAFDFKVTAEKQANGKVTLRVSAEGAGRHTFRVRADNLVLDQPQQTLDLEPGKPREAVWRASIASEDMPWVAVVVPDGVLSQRREMTGTR